VKTGVEWIRKWTWEAIRKKTRRQNELAYLFDTDTINLTFRNHPQVIARTARTPAEDIFISSLSAEELLRGILSEINRARSRPTASIAALSLYLVDLLEGLAEFQILPYTDEAERLFRSFPASVKRIGGMDCRIAAHAIVSGSIVITRNTQDFARIPGVQLEDWSV